METPLFLFAPGAGAPFSHPWMQRWIKLLETIGRVRAFDYPYMIESRKRPDPLPLLLAAHRAALSEARRSDRGPVFLIGKSMGSRIGCHVSLEENVAGLVCFGYPLCSGGDPRKLRAKVLREITAPILFVQGTRDPLCPLELLEHVRTAMIAPTQLHVVEGGDHSLVVTKTRLRADNETQENVEQRILQVIGTFAAGHSVSIELTC